MERARKVNLETLSRLLQETGDRALAYTEELKYGVREHVTELLKNFPNLAVKDEQYTHNDGRSVRLMKLDGTLPMYYQNTKYNIPLSIWISETYPHEPPMVYVTPTPGMIIKPNHTFVDPTGAVLSPYLKQHWNVKYSNLVDMAYDMAILFGQEPPLFSKPPGYVPPVPRPQTSHPPAGGVFQGNNPMVRPAYPPPATSAGGFPYGGGMQGQGGQGLWWDRQHPPGGQVNPQQMQQQQQQTQVHPSETDLMNRFRSVAIKALTTRLTAALEERQTKISKEAQDLMENEKKLSERTTEIIKKVSALQEERGLLEARVRMMAAQCTELSTWLQQVGSKVTEDNGSVDPESVIVPADALCAQALETQAGDMAAEDTLYALDKALQHDIIDLDAYLKQVRKLCKQQFFCRALGMKIGEAQQLVRPGGNSGHAPTGVLMPQGDSWATSGMLINPLNPGART